MISYKNVVKIYGIGKTSVTAIDNVTFNVDEGELVVFLGPSGCGKTTLLRMTNRLESITSGKIQIRGKNIFNVNPVKLRRSIGYVIQQIGLFPNKTIFQNIAIIPEILGWNKDKTHKRVEELLKIVNLEPKIYLNRYPIELSGGQQQRVGVARALAANPDILLMDEPFGAIDPINRDKIQDEFLKIQLKLKKTVVFVSHDIHEAIKMADKIVIFKNGAVVQYETPETILTCPKNKFVSDFVGADRILKVLSLLKTKDAMKKNPKNIIQAKILAPAALKFMESKQQRTAIVLNHTKPVGYVTLKLLKFEEGPTIDVVEPFPITVEENEPLRDVLSSMLMYDMSMLCVINEQGDLIGTITYQNIQQQILSLYKDDTSD